MKDELEDGDTIIFTVKYDVGSSNYIHVQIEYSKKTKSGKLLNYSSGKTLNDDFSDSENP